MKEAPQRGWFSGAALGLLLIVLVAGGLFVWRTWRARSPIVRLHLLRRPELALACSLSFVTGFGLYGFVYLMPVFLGFVRQHGPLAIGSTMLVTGVAQLAAAPLVVQSERFFRAVDLALAGFLAFGVGLALSASETPNTDFDEMVVPQLVRGAAVMLCLLAPTRLALGGLDPRDVPDGSALFNVMRNLGGAIGIALIDTLIAVRAPQHAAMLIEGLQSRDPAAIGTLGLPPGIDAQPPLDPSSLQALLQPLVERASLVLAINDAWAMLAAIVWAGAALTLLFVANRNDRKLGSG